jgi:hypothetical protein
VDVEPVAAAIRAAPGRLAVLAGAGVSRTAGIMTGEDLLRRQAAELGDDAGPHPVGWYRQRHGVRPSYIGILQSPAGTLGAARLPGGHFEAVPGAREPTPAHRALAAMAAAGHLGPLLTTNFDPLLELALARSGVACTVAASLGSMARAARRRGPRPGAGCLLVKLHGDYRDLGIRHTSAGRDRYHAVIDALLDWVLGDHGLLVCGWSGAWDVALGRALARTAGGPTFWLLRGSATPEAARLIALRRARVVAVPSSDAGLEALAAAVLGEGTAGRDRARASQVQALPPDVAGDALGHQVADRRPAPEALPDQGRGDPMGRHLDEADPAGDAGIGERVAGSRAGDQAAEAEQPIGVPPGEDAGERVGADDQEQLDLRVR